MAFHGLIGGKIGRWLLNHFVSPPGIREIPVEHRSDCSAAFSRLESLFGEQFRQVIKGKVVLDYGCGYGEMVVALAQSDASLAIGTDIRQSVLDAGRELARRQQVKNRCLFINAHDVDAVASWHGRVDVITSIDGFEHYADPDVVLQRMWNFLRPGGRALISFGPPWWHPYGSHLGFMGVPPWAHAFFTEETLMALRGRYRSDGAQRFEEVEGGLNRMTIGRFERLVVGSGFCTEELHLVPIRGTRLLTRNRWARELLTSMVKASLTKSPHVPSVAST